MNYVIIINTGPGGGTLAYKLATSGKKLFLLERGGYLPREKDNWSSKTEFIDDNTRPKKLGTIRTGAGFTPASNTTLREFEVYSAALLRMRQQDYGEVQHRGDIFQEWPIRYDDLESYYTQAEHLYHMYGGQLGQPSLPFVRSCNLIRLPLQYPQASTAMTKHIGHWIMTTLLSVIFATPVPGGEYFERDSVSIGGYDLIAYCAEMKPVRGLAEFHAECQGPTFYFYTAADRDTFTANLDTFAPQ